MPVLYRPHRGCFEDAWRLRVEVNDFAQLVRHMRREVESWYPPSELPTENNTTIEYYGRDDRREWGTTYIVLVKGNAWGFTNGMLLRESTSDDVAPALVPDGAQDKKDQQDQ